MEWEKIREIIALAIVRGKEGLMFSSVSGRRLILEKMRRYNTLELANEQMWGKGRNITLVMVDGETFMPLEDIEKISLWRSGEKLWTWILFGIFCVSDTDRSSGNLNLALKRDNRLTIKI